MPDLGGGPDALLDPLSLVQIRLVDHAESLDVLKRHINQYGRKRGRAGKTYTNRSPR